jgi:hypothetical protein
MLPDRKIFLKLTKLFHNILFPIYSAGDLENLQKTISIANHLQCNVHIMHIMNKRKKWRSANFSFNDLGKKEIFERAKSLCHSISVSAEDLKENNENTMTTFCRKHLVDLVLIYENSQNHNQNTWSKIVIKRVATKIGFPILSVSPLPIDSTFKTIVLPIDSTFQLRQLTLAAYIGKLFHSKIHLISLNKEILENGREEAICLYKAYHLLRDNTTIPVECTTANGNTIEEATYEYAEKINADLIFITPVRRTMPILLKWFQARFLYKQPNFSILAS